jgi:hypothetical protein
VGGRSRSGSSEVNRTGPQEPGSEGLSPPEPLFSSRKFELRGEQTQGTLNFTSGGVAPKAKQGGEPRLTPEQRADLYPGIRQGESVRAYEKRMGTADTPMMFSTRDRDPNRRVEFVRIEGGRFDSVPQSERMKAARSWALNYMPRLPVTNIDTGWDILINRDSIKESAGKRSDLASLNAIEAIPSLLKIAVLVESHADTKGRAEILRTHRLYAPLSMEGVLYRVKLTVLEQRDGRRYYVHELTELQKETPTGSPRSESVDSQRAQVGESSVSIGDLLAGVNLNSGEDVRFSSRRQPNLNAQDQADARSPSDQPKEDPPASQARTGEASGTPANGGSSKEARRHGFAKPWALVPYAAGMCRQSMVMVVGSKRTGRAPAPPRSAFRGPRHASNEEDSSRTRGSGTSPFPNLQATSHLQVKPRSTTGYQTRVLVPNGPNARLRGAQLPFTDWCGSLVAHKPMLQCNRRRYEYGQRYS